MSELSSALGGSAPKHHVTAGGKTYPVSLVTQNVKVAFERALFERARGVLAKFRGMYDRDAYNERLDALVERARDGFFALEGEYARAAMGKPGGTLLLLSILMGQFVADGSGGVTCVPFPEIELLSIAAQAPDEIAAVLRAVMAESFPGVDMEKAAAEGQPDPKAPTTGPTGPFG